MEPAKRSSQENSAPASLEALVERVNEWCAQRGIQPLSGQSNPLLTVRTARFYRVRGLLDPPEFSTAGGYSRRHFLQLCAIRILQSQGLPLDRIQTLLYGRADEELEHVLNAAHQTRPPRMESGLNPVLTQAESWHALPLGENAILILRRGAKLTDVQRQALETVFQPENPCLSRNAPPKTPKNPATEFIASPPKTKRSSPK